MALQTAGSAAPIRSTYADDPDYRELIAIFVDGAPERARELTAAFASGDLRELRMKVHQLKGAGGGFGFPGLTECAMILERACQERAPERIAAAFHDTLEYLGRIAM